MLVGNHFAAASEANVSAIRRAASLLQTTAVAFGVFAKGMKVAHDGHAPSAAKFNVIAAQEIVLPVELPPRHVHVHATNSIVVVSWHFCKLRKNASAGTADAVGEISPNNSR